jgi:hypothetical protein
MSIHLSAASSNRKQESLFTKSQTPRPHDRVLASMSAPSQTPSFMATPQTSGLKVLFFDAYASHILRSLPISLSISTLLLFTHLNLFILFNLLRPRLLNRRSLPFIACSTLPRRHSSIG